MQTGYRPHPPNFLLNIECMSSSPVHQPPVSIIHTADSVKILQYDAQSFHFMGIIDLGMLLGSFLFLEGNKVLFI